MHSSGKWYVWKMWSLGFQWLAPRMNGPNPGSWHNNKNAGVWGTSNNLHMVAGVTT